MHTAIPRQKNLGFFKLIVSKKIITIIIFYQIVKYTWKYCISKISLLVLSVKDKIYKDKYMN